MKITINNVTLSKESILVYHSDRSILNDVRMKILRIGKRSVTLEPLTGQKQLIGLPTLRQPFNVMTVDLFEAIECGIYTQVSHI